MLKTYLTVTAASLLALTAAAYAPSAAAQAKEEVEVMHWWTSGGEAAALNVLKEQLQKEGVSWKDAPVAGGGGDAAMTALRARVTAGDKPTSVQLLGLSVHDWAAEGVLADLTPLAEKEHWADHIPPAIQAFSTYEGKWVAAPVNIHRTNWLWINKKLLDKVGGKAPTNWAEFETLAKQFKDAGVTPLAHGGQPWQEATTFDAIVVAVGGNDFYKKAFVDLDPAALGSDTMQKAFDQLRVLRGWVDPNFSGRDWNLASAMVINGEAGMQVMGDWAKGEFIKAGLKPGVDIVCVPYPGSEKAFLFNSDQFAMFSLDDKARQDAQLKLASAIESPSFQESFNLVKGSIPANTEVKPDKFDSCGQKSMADRDAFKATGGMLPSLAHGHAAPAAVKGAIYDVVTNFFNSTQSSADAAKALVDAVALAK
ncbi:MAG: ABC transporter substrate-binding protein [Inquilinus sp.]|uniref:ABC transporter substrate-binding protein n=1 Tax=Inquilinus sp. TaxID=1932117 RepID=UPI003F356E3B